MIRILFSILFLFSNLFLHGQAAPWEGFSGANDRIDQYRKGNVTINVVDKQGNPVRNAQVEVKMTRNAFNFGCAISALSGFTTDGPNPEMDMYLDIFKANFNTAVIENGMKWPLMVDNEGNKRTDIRQKVEQCLRWLDENDIPVRGHNVIWPSWENMPDYLKDHEARPPEIRQIVDERFEEVLSLYKGDLYEWDLVNEPVHHRDLLNIFGEEELATWFEMAKKYDRETPMYINQWYALNGTYHDGYIRLIRDLILSRAPLDGIGLQGHMDVEHFTGPGELEEIWKKLNQYAVFGLPIKITELDINGDKGADVQAQAFENALTLFYSHPAVEGVMIWGFWEGRHWRSEEDAALWRMDGTPKPAAETWKKLVYDTWWTNENITTDKNGSGEIRGYTGEYVINVSAKGKKASKTANLTNDGLELTVVLE